MRTHFLHDSSGVYFWPHISGITESDKGLAVLHTVGGAILPTATPFKEAVALFDEPETPAPVSDSASSSDTSQTHE